MRYLYVPLCTRVDLAEAFIINKKSRGEEEMEKSDGSPDRNILCLFDVDGTLTAPREVSSFPIDIILIGYYELLPQPDAPLPSAFASDGLLL